MTHILLPNLTSSWSLSRQRLENTNFFIVLFYRSLPMDAYFVLDYSFYECSISHECYSLRLSHIPRIVSLTIGSFLKNSYPSRMLFFTIVSLHMNSYLHECSSECVPLRMFIPLRMRFFSVKNVLFRNAFCSSVPLRNAFYSTKMFICEWVIL